MSDCIFCKIVEGALPSNKVFENDNIVAFHDINPEAPLHILIIPKKHIPSMNEVSDEDRALLGELLLTAPKIAKELGIAERGYRLANNCGPEGGQVVYHMHLHLLGGEKLGSFNGKE